MRPFFLRNYRSYVRSAEFLTGLTKSRCAICNFLGSEMCSAPTFERSMSGAAFILPLMRSHRTSCSDSGQELCRLNNLIWRWPLRQRAKFYRDRLWRCITRTVASEQNQRKSFYFRNATKSSIKSDETRRLI